MILLDAIIQVGTLPDPDRLQFASRPTLEPVYSITGQDRLAVGLTAVDHNPLGPFVALERLAQELFGRSAISPLAELELDRVAIAVDRAIEIPPLASDPDICLVDMPLSGDGSLA